MTGMLWPSEYVRHAVHGGHCCGVSHIYNLPDNPDVRLRPRTEKPKAEYENFCRQNPTHSHDANDTLPEQTAGERIVDIISQIKGGMGFDQSEWGLAPSGRRASMFGGYHVDTGRTVGIVEVILSDGQLLQWKGFIEGLGFRVVNTSRNSNSGRVISIFHLNTGG